MIGTAALLAAAAAVIGFIFARGGRDKGNTGTQAVPAPAETAGVSQTANQNYGGFQFTLPQGYILSEETADAVTWTRQDDSKAAIRFLAPRTVNASEGPEEDTAKNPEPTEAPAVTRGIFLLSDGEMGGRQITASFQPEDEPFVYAVQLGETQAAVQENRLSFEQMLLDVKPLGFSGLQRGAEAGDPVSMEMLAECYENGEGTAQNITQAVHWYTAAAEAGSTKAMLMLAQLYENGTLLLQDDEKAFEWYGRAAEAGSWKGMYNMMWCLYEGRGTEKDLAEAKRWLQKAAAASDTVSLSRVPAELLQDHETVEFTEYDFYNTSLGVELYMNHAGYTFD